MPHLRPDSISKAINDGLRSAGDFLSRIRVTDPLKLVQTLVSCGVVVGVVAAIVATNGAILAPLAADPVHGAEAVAPLIGFGYLCYEGISSGAGLGLA